MRFQILGPLRAFADDGQRQPLRPREAKVLAMLLLAADEPISLPRLIDGVWGDDAPATARRQIQNSVWRLRKAFPIVSDGPGYRLRIAAEELDAAVFRAGVRQASDALSAGQLEDAARLFRAALGLWQGPALAGHTGHTIQAGAARLDEQRLSALEQCLEIELRLGRHDDLIAELTELVAAYPLRERLVGHLMAALHRGDRPADASQVYHSLRARLADSLGIDPGQAVRELHAAILRDDLPSAPSSGGGPPRVTVPRQLPPPVRNFVGRTDELKDLAQLADASDSGSVVIAAISGTGGVGKPKPGF